MITLRRLQVLLVVVHVGAAFVQLVTTYFNGYFTHYGMDGWLAHTPIGAHFDLESSDIAAHDVDKANIPGMFRFIFNLGDTVNGLAWVDYDWMYKISSVNFLFILVLALRLFSIGMWFATAGALTKVVLDSNLLSSKVGLVVLFGGIGILSSLGILF